MTKILVTGSNGQLGNEIRTLVSEFPFQFTFTDVAELDITNIDAIENLFKKQAFDFVINCAAYTNVNKAESEEDIALQINAIAPKNLARICNKYNAKFIHISTDYVFDGKKFQPYIETDAVCPQSAYGRTKLKGEEFAFSENSNTIVIRTAWLYSSFGNNFVKTMMKLGKEKDELNVVFDQIGTPTYASDLATAILSIIQKVENKNSNFFSGIYHFSNEGVCSWYDFTKEIHQLAKVQCKVNPIETKDFPSPAQRPFYSVLNKQKIKDTFHIDIPYWKDSLAVCINKLQQQ
ncbi:MAG: dTDP-4-dehydrorhamnose reductase [Bacteroidales bacterium]|nr:dTDP-4-dehydrorhamnose reductase [Bacteroidales bacterium]